MENKYPLVIVFYLDADMMKIKEIIQPFVESVNHMLKVKDANAMAFFLPTKGEERVECINPVIMKEADMEKVNKIIEDIKYNFSVGVDVGIDEEEISLDSKPCDCGNNPDGECNCK